MRKRNKGAALNPEVERQFQELAQTNWEMFKSITGVDLEKALICLKKKKGKTLRQISNELSIPKSTIQDICKKCTE